MAGFSRPGVYVNERLLPAPVAATATANAVGAAVGLFPQGPNTVTVVRSWYEFTKTFGGYNANYPATIGVGEFFKNGGTELYIRRVLGTGATQAAATITTGSAPVATATAIGFGTNGNLLRITPQLTRTVSGVKYYTIVISQENGGTSGSLADDIVLEQYFNVRFDDPSSSDFIGTVINNVSQYITIAVVASPGDPQTGVTVPLSTGSDGSPAVTDNFAILDDFLITDRPLVIFAPEILNYATDTSLVAAAGSTSASQFSGTAIQASIASWAAANDGFAVLDTVAGLTPAQAVTAASALSDGGSHTAVYYPNIYISDPLGRNATQLRLIGPAGSVAGLYLATDAAQGPFKAPAGLRSAIRSAVATERLLKPTELDTLNSAVTPVNAIRDIPGAGTVVMGARTLLQDGTANRYVSMRRSLIYLKKELEQITQFAIFENNDERLWGRIRTVVGIFLNDYRNRGGLRGDTPTEAYYVKCDGENNPDSDIQNGIVNVEVGVALEYPAEFVSITLTQTTTV
jgi:hypothetical protein